MRNISIYRVTESHDNTWIGERKKLIYWLVILLTLLHATTIHIKEAAATEKGFGLNEAVQQALSGDPRLYGSHWEAEAARHDSVLARRPGLPQINLSGQTGYEDVHYYKGGPKSPVLLDTGEVQRTESGEAVTRVENAGWTNSGKYGVDLSWTIFEFGAGMKRIDAAQAREMSAVLKEARTRDITIFDVVLSYFDLYRIRRLLDINQKSRIAHRELTRIVQVRVEHNQAAEVRLKEAVLKMQDIEMERQDLMSQEKQAVESYRLVTGKVPPADLLEPASPARLSGFTVDNVDALMERAEKNHVELASLRKDIEAQGYDVEAMRRQHLPKVSLFAGYTYTNNDYTYTGGADYGDAQAGVKVTMPLFGQEVDLQVQELVAKREAQIGRYQRLVREVRRNIRIVADTILSLEAREGQLQENAKSAEELTRLRKNQFEVQSMGDDGVLSMSNALQQQFRSEAAAFNAGMKLRLSKFSLEDGLGMLDTEFREPRQVYTDMTAGTDMPMNVPQPSLYHRLDQERYDILPQATDDNGLKNLDSSISVLEFINSSERFEAWEQVQTEKN